MAQSEIECVPLSPVLGVEVRGIDWQRELDGSMIQRLRDLWHRHALLLFRGQSLSVAQQDRAAGIFGVVTYADVWGGMLTENQSHVSNVVPDALAPKIVPEQKWSTWMRRGHWPDALLSIGRD